MTILRQPPSILSSSVLRFLLAAMIPIFECLPSFLPSSPLIALSPFPIERVENFKTVPENRREEDGMDGQREGSSSNDLKYVKPGLGGYILMLDLSHLTFGLRHL